MWRQDYIGSTISLNNHRLAVAFIVSEELRSRLCSHRNILKGQDPVLTWSDPRKGEVADRVTGRRMTRDSFDYRRSRPLRFEKGKRGPDVSYPFFLETGYDTSGPLFFLFFVEAEHPDGATLRDCRDGARSEAARDRCLHASRIDAEAGQDGDVLLSVNRERCRLA